MEHRKLVLPEFLNNQGYLFGGNLLKWVDESAYITASLDFPSSSRQPFTIWIRCRSVPR